MFARIARKVRALRIRLLEQDLQYAAASYDAHVAGITQKLSELRREQWDDLTAEGIARDIDRRGWRHG